MPWCRLEQTALWLCGNHLPTRPPLLTGAPPRPSEFVVCDSVSGFLPETMTLWLCEIRLPTQPPMPTVVSPRPSGMRVLGQGIIEAVSLLACLRCVLQSLGWEASSTNPGPLLWVRRCCGAFLNQPHALPEKSAEALEAPPQHWTRPHNFGPGSMLQGDQRLHRWSICCMLQ